MKNDTPNEAAAPDETTINTPEQTTVPTEQSFTQVPEGPQQAPSQYGELSETPIVTERSFESVQPAPFDNTATTVPSTPPTPPKKSRKGLFAVIIGMAAVLLIGGGTAFAYFFWYQNPDKVIGDALSNALSAQSVEFKSALTVSPDENTNNKMTITFNGKANRSAGAVDVMFELINEGKTVKVDGSLLASQKDLYVKVNNLDGIFAALLGASGGSNSDTPYRDFVAKINGNWIKISEGDLTQFSAEYSKTQSCTTDLAEKISNDKSYSKELSDTYKNNLFIVVGSSLGSRAVNDVDSLGYEVTVDNTKLKAFVKAVGETKAGKELAACDTSIDFNKIAESFNEDDRFEGTTELWVSRFGHQLTGVNTTANSKGVTTATVSTFSFNKEVAVDVPTDSMTLKEVTDEYMKMIQQPQATLN